MEDLKITDASGATLLTRGLADEKGPLLVLRREEGVELAETAPVGVRVVGALLRDEDGWTLASSDPAAAVTCGGKGAGALPLVPGAACRIGELVFRIETDASNSGNVLLWRVGRAAVAAEPVMAGRNLVAADALGGGAVTVNPAVPGAVLFEFYPTLDGLDVVMPTGGRTSFALRLGFAVGDFRGVLLPAAEAAEALKSGDPFGYPARGARCRLLGALLGAGLVCLVAAYWAHDAIGLERAAEEPRGAVREERAKVADEKAYFGDDYVFLLAFYRDLPLVLGAKPSPVTADLIRRAGHYADNADVQRAAKFLKDVTTIQETIQAQRWDQLAACLDQVDAEAFVIADATRFLKDAREVQSCANVLLPKSCLRYVAADAAERAKIDAEVAGLLEGMSDNVFIASDVTGAWLRRIEEVGIALKEFLDGRDAVFAAPSVAAEGVMRLRALHAELERVLGGARPELLKAVRGQLADYARRALTDLFARHGESGGRDRAFASVSPLCELAADVGVEPERLAEWRQRAAQIARAQEARLRELHQTYRLNAYDRPDEARRALEEMLAIGDPTDRYHAWAVREKARLEAEAKR